MNNLKKVITQEGITQAQLARASNKSQGTVNKICNNARIGSPTTNHALLKAINSLIGEDRYSYNDVFPNSNREIISGE